MDNMLVWIEGAVFGLLVALIMLYLGKIREDKNTIYICDNCKTAFVPGEKVCRVCGARR